MKRSIGAVAGTTAIIIMSSILGTAAPASADDDLDLNRAVSNELKTELLALADQSGSTMSITDVSVAVSSKLAEAAGSDDPVKIADYIVADVKRQADNAQTVSVNPALEVARPPSLTKQTSASRKTVGYTADQSTVLPAFGVAWVNQDMSVTFSGTKISSVKLRGSSYGTGISVFAYSPVRTTISYSKSQTCLLTRMKGTFSAIVKGSAVAFSASVLAADGPRGGRMVNLNTNNC
jgi:hypothetical protein